VPFPIVALVGYTNAGKSTLFNRLTGAEVFAKDMLFATLDPTMRSVELPDGPQVILSDTVGFISDLPTELVASFRATLEEVLAADLILHVRDISHEGSEEQARDVREIMTTLGVGETANLLEVWNKIDLLEGDAEGAAMARAERDDAVFAISSITGAGLPELIAAIEVALEGEIVEETLVLDYARGKDRAWLFERNLVQSETMGEDGFELELRWSAKQRAQFEGLSH
jgi:GTP-binding protein HflX